MGTCRNTINQYPPEIRAEVDQLIERNSTASSIRRLLQEKYSAQVSVPSLPAVLRYMKYYRTEKKAAEKNELDERLMVQFSDGLREIESVLAQVQRREDPEFNKIRLLEGLVGKCLMRMNALETVSAASPKVASPGLDAAIVKYVSEIRGIIESVLKLSANFKTDEQETIRLVRLESKALLELVRSVVVEVCPEKYGTFATRLREKLQMSKIPTGVPENGSPQPVQGPVQEQLNTTENEPKPGNQSTSTDAT